MLRFLLVLGVLLPGSFTTATTRPGRPAFANQVIYADSLAAGWADWSWASVDLAASSPVHSGDHSIAVSYTTGWQGLFLHHPQVATAGFTHLRFFIHGGNSSGQAINLYVKRAGAVPEDGPPVALPIPTAGAWREVRLPLADLDAADAAITGIVWQSNRESAQPVFYIDDIALVADEDPQGPSLSAGDAIPRSIPADGATGFRVRVQVSDPQGLGDIAAVTLNGGPLGHGDLSLSDDGRHADGAPGDGLYGAVVTVASASLAGEATLLVSAQDRAGHSASLPLGTLTILAPPGGQIPPDLPSRIGWGSNAWVDDWQGKSGVPWDYVYQYITWDWETWGTSFVQRFVDYAWSKGYIPVVTVYLLLGVPPECNDTEAPTCYAQKLQNAGAVQNYLASLQRAAEQAQGDQPVIFLLEPDFYGYMQQYSNQADHPPGVQPDDPASYSVSGLPDGYPENLAGFGRRLVDLIHIAAPNALVAPMASMWATNGDPQSTTADGAVAMAQRTAAFIDAMGGAEADLLAIEWSDRDAGRGIRPWWDDLDRSLPRPTRAILWENALGAAADKRLLLWQVPLGNMSLDNSPQHYQDNRLAYLFHHPRDVFDAGIVGVLFGGGDGESTQPATDGGFLAAQGAIAYAPPATPAGLAVDGISGPSVGLHWNENTEPDLWRYRVFIEPASGGGTMVTNTGPRNATELLLPAGEWHLRVQACDAMNHCSTPSTPVTAITPEGVRLLFLPTITRTRPGF